MRLVGYQKSDLEVSRIDSLGELQELRLSGAIDTILGENIEAAHSCFLVRAPGEGWKIGIVSVGLGHNTGIVKMGDLRLVYNDQCWYLFDADDQLISQGKCDGIIYEIVPDYEGFIVIHEIGAAKIALDGKCIWKVNSELVEDHRIEGTNLVLVSGGIVDSFDTGSGKKIVST